MTVAEMHGKISDSNISERMEDLLTLDVFGCLRYLSTPDRSAALPAHSPLGSRAGVQADPRHLEGTLTLLAVA